MSTIKIVCDQCGRTLENGIKENDETGHFHFCSVGCRLLFTGENLPVGRLNPEKEKELHRSIEMLELARFTVDIIEKGIDNAEPRSELTELFRYYLKNVVGFHNF